jgi:hypothetical protein
LYNRCIADAEVAELADAPALGAGGRKAVGVRVPSSAFIFALHYFRFSLFSLCIIFALHYFRFSLLFPPNRRQFLGA